MDFNALVSGFNRLAEDEPEGAAAVVVLAIEYSRADTAGRRRIDAALNRWLRESARRPVQPRVSPRPRAPRRSPRRGTVKTAQDPGSDDGDSDPDSDPVGAAVARLLADAPPFSVGQRELLGRILGGAR